MGEESDDLYMDLVLSGGYALRHALDIIKNEVSTAAMVITPDEITISFLSNKTGVGQKISHLMVFRQKDFTTYRYNFVDEDGELLDRYTIGFSTADMTTAIKTIGKKDGVRIYLLKEDNKLSIEPMAMGHKNFDKVSALYVKMVNVSDCTIYDPPQTGYTACTKIQPKEFANICSSVTTLKCENLVIDALPNTTEFRVIDANGSVMSINMMPIEIRRQPKKQMENKKPEQLKPQVKKIVISTKSARVPSSKPSNIIVKSESEKPISRVKIGVSTCKSLRKINNLAPAESLIQIEHGEDVPMKIRCNIGTFGEYVMCVSQ